MACTGWGAAGSCKSHAIMPSPLTSAPSGSLCPALPFTHPQPRWPFTVLDMAFLPRFASVTPFNSITFSNLYLTNLPTEAQSMGLVDNPVNPTPTLSLPSLRGAGPFG